MPKANSKTLQKKIWSPIVYNLRVLRVQTLKKSDKFLKEYPSMTMWPIYIFVSSFGMNKSNVGPYASIPSIEEMSETTMATDMWEGCGHVPAEHRKLGLSWSLFGILQLLIDVWNMNMFKILFPSIPCFKVFSSS